MQHNKCSLSIKNYVVAGGRRAIRKRVETVATRLGIGSTWFLPVHVTICPGVYASLDMVVLPVGL